MLFRSTLTARKGPTPVFTRASTATFVGSDGLIQSAAINEPRFDHDPITLACKGLLIEEARTNLLAFSNQLDNFYWTRNNLSVTVDQTTAPDGTVTGDKIIEDTANSSHYIGKSLVLTSGQTYTQSYFLKADGRTKVQIRRLTGSALPTPPTIIFDLSSGTYSGSVVSGWTNPFIENFGNGWYRIGISATATSTTSDGMGLYLCDAGGNISYLGDGTSGVYAWGAQLEAGAFPTSYIPTTTASVVRSVDLCDITGSDFTGFYNGSEGTMVATASAVGFTSNNNNTVVAIDSGTIGVMRILHRVAAGNKLSALVSGVQLTPASNYNTANVIYKSALAAGVDGADYVIDGTQIPDTFTGSVLTADNLKFSGVVASTSNTTISSFRYYKKRLATAKLVSLTS